MGNDWVLEVLGRVFFKVVIVTVGCTIAATLFILWLLSWIM